MVVKARRLPLLGLYNARDLGGFPTSDGNATKFGVFVRSEAPCALPGQDIDDLIDYGVTVSIDLRGSGEKKSRPSDLSKQSGIEYYEKPLFNEAVVIGADMGKTEGLDNPKAHKRPPAGVLHDWGEQYKRMAEESRAWALDVLTIAAQTDGVMHFHCTTGKDRTGMLTCYLLSIAGVDRADIAADYCVSQVYLEPLYERIRAGMVNMGIPQEKDGKGGPGGPDKPAGSMMDEAFFQTPASAMFALIDYLTEKYGSVVDYLHLIGVTDEMMEKIRAKFII